MPLKFKANLERYVLQCKIPPLLIIIWVQPAHETLLELLACWTCYISEIIDLEGPPADQLCFWCQSQQGYFRCKSCFSQALLCHSCCFTIHCHALLHHIEKWTGKFFNATSLNQEGFILYLGHGGEPCPASHTGRMARRLSLGAQMKMMERERMRVMGSHLQHGRSRTNAAWLLLTLLGTSIRIGWCQCTTAAEPHIQLLRSHFFPATIKWPSTAFTFSLLDYFTSTQWSAGHLPQAFSVSSIG